MNLRKIKPQYLKKPNPRIGLIALASDFMIEKDFVNVINGKKIDFFVNRIECYNPLTSKNLIKMSKEVTNVTKEILPNQKIDCIAYGCTSGTIAAGFKSIEKKIKKAKPNTKVVTPSTAAIKALKKMNIKKISLFTPYPKKLNDEVFDFFVNENFIITSNSYFNIKSDIDILILYEKSKLSHAKELAENILYKLWDTGLEIGNSLRSINECLELASMQDSSILSSLMDVRAITGDSNLCMDLIFHHTQFLHTLGNLHYKGSLVLYVFL